MSTFQIIGLAPEPFAPWFALSDAELHARGACLMVADEENSYPCRVSLTDAKIGERLLLLPYQHLAAPSPYQALGPIFVKAEAQAAVPTAGEVPVYVSRRLISVRAYDASHRMIDAEVCPGDAVAAEIARMFANQQIAYLHLHNARRGCYSCRVERV
jgi:hypothetical protein